MKHRAYGFVALGCVLLTGAPALAEDAPPRTSSGLQPQASEQRDPAPQPQATEQRSPDEVRVDPPAPAPEPAAPAARTTGPQLGEIVVTASRREESLQKVNIAVTAVSPEVMQQQVLRDVKDLQRTTPSLNFSQSPGQVINPIVSLRGQVQNDPSQLTLDPSVGVYLDEVYLGRAPGSLLDFFDIERVEILKGPQGTLYGRNTTGGAIRIIPVKADPSAGWDGFARGGIGSWGDRELEAASNIPVADDLAFRAGVSRRTVDGWGRQRVTDPDDPDTIVGSRKVNNRDQWYGRLGGLWKPADPFDVEAGLDYTRQRTNGSTAYEAAGDLAQQPIPGGPIFLTRSSDGYYTFTSENPNTSNAETWGGYLKGEWRAGPGTTKLIASARKLKYHFNIDVDGTSALGGFIDVHQDVRQGSLELQWIGDLFEDRLGVVAGLYAYRENGDDITDLFANDLALAALGGSLPPQLLPLLGNLPNGPGSLVLVNQDADSFVRNRSVSAFAQLTWRITEQLDLTGGIRPIRDSKRLHRSAFDSGVANQVPGLGFGNAIGGTQNCGYDPSADGVVNDGTDCYFDKKTKYDYTTYTAGIDWRPLDDLLLYVKTSKGARSGGQQLRGSSSASLQSFDPEFVTDVELGLKGDWFGHRLRTNLAAYHSDYEKFQVTEVVQVSTVVRNAGNADIDGAEAELSLAATDQLTLTASGSWIDFRFHDDTFIAAYAPKWQYSVAPVWEQDVAFGSFGGSVGYSWKSRTDLYPFRGPVEANPRFLQQESYGIVTASAFVRIDRWNARLGVFGANLTDEKTIANTLPSLTQFDPSAGGVINTGTPRTWGVDLRIDF